MLVLSRRTVAHQFSAYRHSAWPTGRRVLTLLFLLRHGTHALEMHLRFLPASWPLSSFFPRRPFLAGAPSPVVLLVSMAVRRVG